MAFKMKGSPAKLGTIQGTAGHRSALKARGAAASTSKVVKNLVDTGKKAGSTGSYAKAKERDPNLAEYIKKRKTLKKGSPEWNANQNKINAAYGVKKRYPVDTPKTETKPKPEVKKEKIQAKADKKIAEVDENVDKKSAKQARKSAKKEFGKDSKEFLTAKKKELEAKEADRQGAKGGKKQTIFRRISSKINKRRQEKVQSKLDEKSAENTSKKSGEATSGKRKRQTVKTKTTMPKGKVMTSVFIDKDKDGKDDRTQ